MKIGGIEVEFEGKEGQEDGEKNPKRKRRIGFYRGDFYLNVIQKILIK